MVTKGLIVSKDNPLKDIKIKENIKFIFIRVGFTDYNIRKTKNIDTSFIENYELAIRKKLKIGVYYESRATKLEEAIDEIIYFLNQIKDKKIDYPVMIQIEDDHNTIIYHPHSQKKIKSSDLLKIVTLQVNEIRKNGYYPVIRTYESWYKDIFKDNIDDVKYFLDCNQEYFKDVFYEKNDIVFNNISDKNTKIEIYVKENDLLVKIKMYLKAGYKFIKRKIGFK